jgi:hypothetical protein
MHHFDVLLNFVRKNKGISVCLSLGEHNSFALFTIANEDISKGRESVLEGTVDSKMLNLFSSLIFEINSQVDHSTVLLHVVVCDLTDPSRNRG